MSRPLPGYSIPHELSEQEKADFFTRNLLNAILNNYMLTHDPPYGVVINEAYGQILVWYSPSNGLHVVDVTNMAIAHEIQKAPYESPDTSTIGNIIQELNNIVSGAGKGAEIGVSTVMVIFAFWLLAKWKK